MCAGYTANSTANTSASTSLPFNIQQFPVKHRLAMSSTSPVVCVVEKLAHRIDLLISLLLNCFFNVDKQGMQIESYQTRCEKRQITLR